MSLSFNFNPSRSAEQPATATAPSSSSSTPSSTASSDSSALPPPPPASHPPCASYLAHIAAHGLVPPDMPLPAACSRSSLHGSTSAADIRTAFSAIDRLTAQHLAYVPGLADALQHDMAVVSAEVHSQPPQPPQPLSPFADYFLHAGFSQSVRLLLQRYVELASLNAASSQSLVAIARGAPKRTVHPFDLLRVYSALRDSVAFGCSVFGAVSGAARGAVVDVWSMLFKGVEPWLRINAGSWVNELSVSKSKQDDDEDDEEDEEQTTEDEERRAPPATHAASRTTALSAGSGEKRQGAVMPSLVPSMDPIGALQFILGHRRSSPNKAHCDAAYEAEGESEEDVAVEVESGSEPTFSEGDDETEEVPRRNLWDSEPGGDGYAADTAADVDMATKLPAPTSPRTPLPSLTASFPPTALAGTPRPLSPATATLEQDDSQLLQELDVYGQYRDVAWWRRKVVGEEGWQVTMPPAGVHRESLAYPLATEKEEADDETLSETADATMDDAAAATAATDEQRNSYSPLVPALPRRLRKLSNSPAPWSAVPSWLAIDVPHSFSHWCVSENDGLYYQELLNFFGQQGGFSLLLASLPAAPLTTCRFLICRPVVVADTVILTPTEHAALQQAGDRPSLLYVRDVLGLLHVLVGKPSSGLQLRLVVLFVARVIAYCLSLTDAQLQRESKQQVSELVTLCTLLASQQHTLPLASHLERFESDFSLYLLRCASLEKRIHGLSHIKRLLEVEQDRRLGLTSTHGAPLRPLMDHTSPLYTRPVASPFVLLPSYTRYLQRAAVIETLFGEGLHVQLLRRSMSLLRCMAQQQCVSAQQLDCMWAATRGKHETVAAQVYCCLTTVIAVLPLSGLLHLFDRLSSVSVSEIDGQFVALVRCVVHAAMELHMPTMHDHTYCRFDPSVTNTDTDSLPARGLDFLWRLFNERQLPTDSLLQAAFEHLQALLLSDAACPLRRTYLLRCVDNVKRQWNVPHALWLLFDLIDTFSGQSTALHTPSSGSATSASASSAALPTSPFKQLLTAGVAINTVVALSSAPRIIGAARRTSGVDDRSEVIEHLNADNALLSCFFHELSAFAAQPVGVAGVFPAAKTFEMRLLFLDYVYRHCKSLTIDYATVAVLWSHFISPLPSAASAITPPPSFDPECRDVLFCFLTSTFSSPSTDPSLPSFVFHQLIPLLPFTTLSPSGFMLFHLLFLSTNRAEGKISCHSPTPLSSSIASTPHGTHHPLLSTSHLTFTVRCAPSALSGFEYVWELACECAVDEVGNEATRMLQRMHAQVEASGLGGLTESYERCVAKAMERIVRVRAELEEEASGARKARLGVEMERCFNILNILLDQPHYSDIAASVSFTSPTAASSSLPASPASSSLSSPATGASSSSSASPTRLLACPASQRCRPPHLVGALLYLSQDYPPLPPSAPAAYNLVVTINYPLSDMMMGQFDVRLSSHATVDELLVTVQRESAHEKALLELAGTSDRPFPFPLIDLCEFGSDQSLTTRENRRKRLGELAPAPARAGEEVRWELKLRCKGEDVNCRYDPTHACPACGAALPLWVYLCRCGHDDPDGEVPAKQRMWDDTKALCHQWDTEFRHLQQFGSLQLGHFPLLVWRHAQPRPYPLEQVLAYPLPKSSVWYRREEAAEWQDDDVVDLQDDPKQLLTPAKQAAYLAAMRGGVQKGAGRAAGQSTEERKPSGSGLKIVLRKDKDKEGEFSAGEMPTPAASDMDTDKQPPVASMQVVHPSVILSRVEYVDELFKLLAMSSSDTQLSEKCWQLLMRLDINVQLLRRLYTLNQPHTDWSTLLDSRNVAKLQYSLIIVRLLMQGHAHSATASTSGKAGLRVDVDGEAKQRAGDEWQQRFLDLGGVAHLLHVLVSRDILADAIPLQQSSTQPSASCLSFHQSLALQCVMSLLAICTDILRNPNVKQRHEQTTMPSETSSSTSSTPATIPALSPPLSRPPHPALDQTDGSLVAAQPVEPERSDDVDMASESATRKRKDAVGTIEQPAKKLKPTDDTTTASATATTTATTISTSASNHSSAHATSSHSLYTPHLLSQLLALMLHCASLPLYQPAPTVSAHSRSSDVLSSVLRAMDERIAEVAADVEQILPPTNVATVTTLAATAATPSFVDSPTAAIAELALPSPSPTTALSPLSPLYGPTFDPHRDEVSGVYSACMALVQYVASQVSTAQLQPFVNAEAVAALVRTALLCSPRSCIRQCTNALLLQLCYAAHRPPQPVPATATQPDLRMHYPLAQLMFDLLLQLLTATPLSELQGRWRHQTEPLFAVMIRLTNDFLWCDFDLPTDKPTPQPQKPQQPHRAQPLSVLLTLFSLIRTLSAEREADATADQTAVGLLWLTALFVQLQHRIDTHRPRAPPRLYGQETIYPPDAQHHSPLASHITQSAIIPFLYTQGLFQVKAVHSAADLQSLATSPLFRFPSTRQAALELLIGLSSTSIANHTALLGLSLKSHPHRVDLVHQAQYNYQPSLQRKPPSCPHVGLHNLGATCLAESDTRVLTNSGFLFLTEIEARIKDEKEVLYACYDTSTQCIVYRPGKLVLPAAPPTRWVDFTHAGTRRLWDTTSNDYGSTVPTNGVMANHITLRTTPDHDMYVQPCTQHDDARQSHLSARKMRAEELAPGFECTCSIAGKQCVHGWPCYRMFTGALNGVQSSSSISLLDGSVNSPVAGLGLRTEDELSAFLSVFGYWLSDGTLVYDHGNTIGVSAVCFHLHNDADRSSLLELLARLSLAEGTDWTVNCDDLSVPLRITSHEWFRFFDAEFGCSYQHSPRFNADLASLEQRGPRQQALCDPLEAAAAECTDMAQPPPASQQMSAKWLPDWILHRLPKHNIRDLLSGLRHSTVTTTAQQQQQIRTSGIAFRDQLVQACLHAGFSVYFKLHSRAGGVRGYRSASNDSLIYSEAQAKALVATDPTRHFLPVIDRYDSWSVVYSDSVSHILQARDIRYDGKLATEPSEEYQPSDGRAWCVEVQHDDHLVFVQRAHTNRHGVVTKAGRAVITSNCYMNSLMQQLYFTPPFRYGLFVQRHWDAMPRVADDTSSSVVYQMQLLMAQLQESVQRFYDARSFCQAYRDYEGACLTGDHRVLTRTGWRSITAMRVGDEVMSFNVDTYAQEWKRVDAVTSHPVKRGAKADQLYRMHGSGMDVIATRDHRMLLLGQVCNGRLQEREPLGYDTVGNLLGLSYRSEDTPVPTLVCAGLNQQPAVKVVIPGLERVCELWWETDGQLGFLRFLGIWLSDGWLDTDHGGRVAVSQWKVEFRAWLEALLDELFPSWWYRSFSLQHARDISDLYYISCPPLYNYLRVMAFGPVGYNPLHSSSLRNYPHFTADDVLAAKEQQSDPFSYQPNSAWTEEAMLTALTTTDLTTHLSTPPSPTRSLHSASSGEPDCDVFAELSDEKPQPNEKSAPAGTDVCWLDNGLCRHIDQHWFSLKRWLGEQNVADVYSQLSKQQAIALLDGFCRADSAWSNIGYDDGGEPTGVWECKHSSFPLVDHLQLIGQLAGAAVNISLHEAGQSHTMDGRSITASVDHWQLSLQFIQSKHGIAIPTTQLAQPVDVSSDIDARGYHDYNDDGNVHCITVESNSNFFTQRLSTSPGHNGDTVVSGRSVVVGNCMQLNTQMDVQEFANILFDQIEKELKSTRSHQLQLLNHVYGGKIVNQLICQQCGNRNERDEDYYMLSLDVKNKHSILNSLALYTDGELLEGDNKAQCSRCNRKTDTVKRVCVKTLPPHLILHLKRFEFDLDSMRKYKVNDYCEFPVGELDLFPYTKEGIEAKERKDDDSSSGGSKDDSGGSNKDTAPTTSTPVQPAAYYQYSLSGVLVHTGTCNSGHYYSFVKDRTADGGWWSCNDTNVEVLNPDSIKESCYGGGEMVSTYDVHTRKHVTNFVSKPYSAYMLFYDRVETRPADKMEMAVREEEKVEGTTTAMQLDNDAAVMTDASTAPSAATSITTTATSVDRDALAVSPPSALPDLLSTEQAASLVPPLIFKEIWEKNAVFLSDCYTFDTPYFHFAHRLIKSGLDWWQAMSQQQKDERLRRYKSEESAATPNFDWRDLVHARHYEGYISLLVHTVNSPRHHVWSDDLLYHSGKFAIHFLLHTYAHARCKSVLEGWDGWLRQMMDSSYRLSCYLLSLLATERQSMQDLVLQSGLPSFRTKWNDIVLAAMLKCQTVYDERYEAAKKNSLQTYLSARGLHPYIADYMYTYLQMLPIDVQDQIKNCQTYFSFLLAFLQVPNQPRFTSFLLQYPRLITSLLQFFLSVDSEAPTTGVSINRHRITLTVARDSTPVTGVAADTRVLMADGSAKIARLVAEGEVLVSESGAERRVEELVPVDDDVEEAGSAAGGDTASAAGGGAEDEEQREVESESKWRAFRVSGGSDYLLADLVVVRNDSDRTVIGDRSDGPHEPDGEREQDDNEEAEDEEEEAEAEAEFEPIGQTLDLVPADVWDEQNNIADMATGIPPHCLDPPRRLDLVHIHTSLRKMKPLRKKFSDKLKPFASLLATFLDLSWQRCSPAQRSLFFPFLPFREARLLCHPDLFAALLEMDANVSDAMFGLLCRNAPASVQLQVAQQLTDEIHKTAHGGLPHLFTLLQHFLAIDDNMAGMRVRHSVKKLVVVIRKNEKYKDEYSAMINLTAYWMERKETGGVEPLMSDRVRLLLRDELIGSVVQWDKCALWSDVAPFRAAGLRLLLALAEWRSDAEKRDEMLDTREDEFRAMRVKIARQEGRPVKLINGVLDVCSDDTKADEQSSSSAAASSQSSTEYSYRAPPLTQPHARIFMYVLSNLPTLLKRDRLSLTIERAHYFVETYELLEQLLQHFPKLIALVAEQHVQAIIDGMEPTMKSQTKTDPIKSAIGRLLLRLCTLHAPFVLLLTDSLTSRSKGGEALASIFMFHDPGSVANTVYNETALTPVFQVLLLCCKLSPGFYATLQSNATFDWAVQTLLLMPSRDMYPRVSYELSALLAQLASRPDSGDWRRRMLSKWWPRAVSSRQIDSQTSTLKLMEARLEPWIAVVEQLALTDEDWKALACSWFMQNLVAALQSSENQKLSLQVHERVLALMARMLLWYEAEQLSGNEAVVKQWNDITFFGAVRQGIATYLPCILCQVRVAKPPPPPAPLIGASMGLGKTMTRSAGSKQVGGAIAAKSVKPAATVIVPSLELKARTSQLLNTSPLYRLSPKALIDGLCVCQLLSESDALDQLVSATGDAKRAQFKLDCCGKLASNYDNNVFFGALTPDLYYEGYQSILARYHSPDKWKGADINEVDWENDAEILVVFAVEIAAVAPDTYEGAAVQQPHMAQQYAAWTTEELVKHAKRPTLYPATAVLQEPPPPALLVSAPSDTRLAYYLAILNSYGSVSKWVYYVPMAVELARMVTRRHRQLLLTPVGFHFVASVITTSLHDDDPADALETLDIELRSVSERCMECGEVGIMYRLLVLMKLRWLWDAKREEVACWLVNDPPRYYTHAREKLRELSEWLSMQTSDIQRMCREAVQAEQQEKKSESAPTPMHERLERDWLGDVENAALRRQQEWDANEKARRERNAAARAAQQPIDDRDDDHYPLMLRYPLPGVDDFQLNRSAGTSHIDLGQHDTLLMSAMCHELLLELSMQHERQLRMVRDMYGDGRAVEKWSQRRLIDQRMAATGQRIAPELDGDLVMAQADREQLGGAPGGNAGAGAGAGAGGGDTGVKAASEAETGEDEAGEEKKE